MNFAHMRAVLVKELRDILRDRRTLITTLLLPMIIMPVLFFVMGMGMSNLESDTSENIGIGLTERAATPQVRERIEQMLSGMENVEFVTQDYADALSQERIQVILDVPEDAELLLAAQMPLPIQVIADQSKLKSTTTAGMITRLISQNADAMLRQKLAEQGIVLENLLPATVQMADIRGEETAVESEAASTGTGSPFVSMVLPMLLTVMLWSGAIGASCDMVAGEKERFTLEPLLSTTADRMSLLTGKFLAVMVFMIFSLLSSLAGMALAMIAAPQFSASMGGSLTLNLSASAAILTIISVLALGATFVCVQLALSSLARSMKQAQQWLSIMMLLIMVPAYATMFMQAGDVQAYMMLVPVLGAIASMKMVLGGVVAYDLLGLSLASSLVFLGAALYATTRVFNRESVLFRA